MAVERKKLIQAVVWFAAVVLVLSLLLFLAQGIIREYLLDFILFAVLLFVGTDLIRKYRTQKSTKSLVMIVLSVVVSVSYLIYFIWKVA